MADIKLEAGKHSELAADSTMVAPGEIKTFPVKTLGADNDVRLSFSSINDYGAQNQYTTTLSSGQTSTAAQAPSKQ
ncbi:hypothetical protein D3C77_671340 [compost metagenome]